MARMNPARRRPLLLALICLGLLTACGGETEIGGSVVVNAENTSTLTVKGQGETTLRLEHDSDQPVVVVDGETEKELVRGASMELSFSGPKTLLFKNSGTQPTRTTYRATSPGGIETELEQN